MGHIRFTYIAQVLGGGRVRVILSPQMYLHREILA